MTQNTDTANTATQQALLNTAAEQAAREEDSIECTDCGIGKH